MKSLLSHIILLSYTAIAFSQTTELITVKAGQSLYDLHKEIYRYPDFKEGKVYFLEGGLSAGKLNYNFVSGAMQFISPTGDTLSLADEPTIKYVTIEKDTFYYDNGYLEGLINAGTVKLAIKQKIKFKDTYKIGAFGTASPTLRTENEKTYMGDNRYNLIIAEDLIFVKEKEYYLNVRFRDFVIVTKKNLIKLFPKQKDNIESFLKENNINLRVESDLKKLVQYLAS
jgi:hypothetical protein